MVEDEFWILIERSRRDAGGVLTRQVQLLREHFLARSKAELLAFRDCWDEVDTRVFTWPVWDAACLLVGWVSDDFFGDVRAWIISHGRSVVDRVVADADNLVELASDKSTVESGAAEELNMLVPTVWHELSGDEEDFPPPSTAPADGPSGDRVDLKDEQAVRARFPRLAGFAQMAGPPR